MSDVAVLRGDRSERASLRHDGPKLGPAEVLRVTPYELEVRLQRGAIVSAALALGYPYDARVGDVVLVIGDTEGHYVIGVLHGSGRTTIEVSGDVDLRAVNGVLRLSGDKGVEIAAPEMSLQVDKLVVVAQQAVQRFASLVQSVTDLFTVRAGERHTVIDGASHEQARSVTIVTEEKTQINGKAIYLG